MVIVPKIKTKNDNIKRFFLVLAVLVIYLGYTVHEYGIGQGLSVTALTWAFFVFATPIADAGFLIAFPVRLITGIRMLYTQIGVWTTGIILVVSYLILSPAAFDRTSLLQLFHEILVTPWPLGLIIVLSTIGTYISIVFDDNVIDIAKAKNKKKHFKSIRSRLYYMVFIFIATFALYAFLLRTTDTHIAIL